MSDARQQNSTSYPIPFAMYLSTDHVTLATGKTVTITLRKPGGTFAAVAGAVTEVANGAYELAGNATDRNTLGSNLYYATATGCDPLLFGVDIQVIDPFAAAVSMITPAQIWDYLVSSLGATTTVGGYIKSVIDATNATANTTNTTVNAINTTANQINAVTSQINVNAVTITPLYDATTQILTLRHGDSYSTGDDNTPVTITGMNTYDLTGGTISSVDLSIKLQADAGRVVKPLITHPSTSKTAHTATFTFSSADMKIVHANVAYVWDVQITFTDGTKKTLLYGTVAVADDVTP